MRLHLAAQGIELRPGELGSEPGGFRFAHGKTLHGRGCIAGNKDSRVHDKPDVKAFIIERADREVPPARNLPGQRERIQEVV